MLQGVRGETVSLQTIDATHNLTEGIGADRRAGANSSCWTVFRGRSDDHSFWWAVLVASGVSGTRVDISSVAVAGGCSMASAGSSRCLPGPATHRTSDGSIWSSPRAPCTSSARPSGSCPTPHSCLLRLTLQEDSQITGGTALFAHVSGTFIGTISPQGLLPRNPDGSCAMSQPSLHAVDTVTFSGTLSF
jgi:hypothetical protein